MQKYSAENFIWAAHKYNLRIAQLLKEGKTPHFLQSKYSDYRGYLENVFAGQSILYGYAFLDCLASKLLKTKRWKVVKNGKRIKNISSVYARWVGLFQAKLGKYSAISKFLKSSSTLRSEIPHSKLSSAWSLQPSSYDYDKAKKFHERLILFLKNTLMSKRYKIYSEYREEIQRFADDPGMWVNTWLSILKCNM